MFRTEINTGESLISFGLQQVGVWIVFMVWGVVSSEAPAALSHFGTTGSVLECPAILFLGMGPGILCGHLIRSLSPRAAYAGRWIWILPAIFLSTTLLGAGLHSTLPRDSMDLFFPPSDGEAWWAAMFFTCPVLGCIGYSLGVTGHPRLSSEKGER